VIRRLVLFGATGDLAARFLLPALAAMHAAGALPDRFMLVGAARSDLDDHAFRGQVRDALNAFADDVPHASREALERATRYRKVDLEDPDSVRRAIGVGSAGEPLAAYLALPAATYPAAIASLAAASLPEGSRIVLEKPFGEDRASAVALNNLLADAFGGGDDIVFRVDHALGMATLQNLLRLRLANTLLDAVWDGRHVSEVTVLWEETIALEGRATYYDRAGALKDVMQNHMLQALSVTTMEPPATLGERDVRNAKVEVLRAMQPPDDDRMAEATRRARYTAGRLTATAEAVERTVPSYTEEQGVDAARHTETFAEVHLTIENDRWSGTRFVLRAGKALEHRRKGVAVTFRPVDHPPLDTADVQRDWNQLWIGLEGSEDISLRLIGGSGEDTDALAPVDLRADPPASTLPPYGRVLLDILGGGNELSVRGDEAEEAWRILDPVMRAWQSGAVPMEEYRAGSSGPAETTS
jgi:glucose-6-phosphate 1-dehydrogenase